jgi:hypothetical protein
MHQLFFLMLVMGKTAMRCCAFGEIVLGLGALIREGMWGVPLSGLSQWPESEPGTRRQNSKLCAWHLNDTPSRDETLAIKISTTTPVFHQKTRQIAFAWHPE